MDQTTFLWALGISVTVISSLIGFIVNIILKSHDKGLDKITNDVVTLAAKQSDNVREMAEIKYNYLDRFGKLHTVLGEVNQKLAEISTKLDERT